MVLKILGETMALKTPKSLVKYLNLQIQEIKQNSDRSLTGETQRNPHIGQWVVETTGLTDTGRREHEF